MRRRGDWIDLRNADASFLPSNSHLKLGQIQVSLSFSGYSLIFHFGNVGRRKLPSHFQVFTLSVDRYRELGEHGISYIFWNVKSPPLENLSVIGVFLIFALGSVFRNTVPWAVLANTLPREQGVHLKYKRMQRTGLFWGSFASLCLFCKTFF